MTMLKIYYYLFIDIIKYNLYAKFSVIVILISLLITYFTPLGLMILVILFCALVLIGFIDDDRSFIYLFGLIHRASIDSILYKNKLIIILHEVGYYYKGKFYDINDSPLTFKIILEKNDK